MSRRREISLRLRSLDDIAGIMSAMKGLALMETRVLDELVATQQRQVAGIESCAARFLAWHRELALATLPERELWILFGSEQGFCGDFNEALLAEEKALVDTRSGPAFCLLVGHRLASRVGEDSGHFALPGASVATEVPTVLLRLTRELNRLLGSGVLRGASVCALYHCAASGALRLRRLLPFGDLPVPAAPEAYPPLINMPAEAFLAGLTDHYLYAALNDVLYSSLLVENRQRLAHMESALGKLNDDCDRLQLAYNAQRQQDIIEEIESIMLSADASAH